MYKENEVSRGSAMAVPIVPAASIGKSLCDLYDLAVEVRSHVIDVGNSLYGACPANDREAHSISCASDAIASIGYILNEVFDMLGNIKTRL